MKADWLVVAAIGLAVYAVAVLMRRGGGGGAGGVMYARGAGLERPYYSADELRDLYL